MNPVDLFNQVKEMIEKKDFDGAKKFIEENKDKLGEYLDQAKKLESIDSIRLIQTYSITFRREKRFQNEFVS